MQSPQPGPTWSASGCPRLSSVHVKCRISAHHLQSISSSVSGNFPLSCPLLSQLILFSWDKGCLFSLLSPLVLFSRPVCVAQNPQNTLWRLACKVQSLLWDRLVALFWTRASGCFPRSPGLHAVSQTCSLSASGALHLLSDLGDAFFFSSNPMPHSFLQRKGCQLQA